MERILLTGFEAFGTTPVNPAEQVARALDGEEIDGARVVSRIVPNSFFVCIDAVREAMAEIRPQAVVMLGEYGGRTMLTVERLAQNLNDGARYGLRDNAGRLVQDLATVPDGPVAYHATLPVRAMVAAMRRAGVPADISDVAGTFCCNHLMYGILHHVAANRLPVRAGWIHLPHLPEVAALDSHLGLPSMAADTAAAGVRAGLAALRAHPTDSDEPIASRLQI
ncbi:MAG: pyroglutamyl-peptidase I [Sneathiellaceae bacterium]